MRKEYNGFPSWNQWNVSLWINNDEWLYRRAMDLVKRHGIKRAAVFMAAELSGEKTPDGGRYNLTAIRGAMRGMDQ
jgi:hypothetical protein